MINNCFLAVAVIFATRASRLMSGGVIPGSGGFRYVVCTTGTGRQSEQGKPGSYCSEEEHRSHIH